MVSPCANALHCAPTLAAQCKDGMTAGDEYLVRLAVSSMSEPAYHLTPLRDRIGRLSIILNCHLFVIDGLNTKLMKFIEELFFSSLVNLNTVLLNK